METGRQLGRKRGEYGIPETKEKTSFQKEGVINCASEAESIYIHYQAGNSVILMISWSLMCSWALSFPVRPELTEAMDYFSILLLVLGATQSCVLTTYWQSSAVWRLRP